MGSLVCHQLTERSFRVDGEWMPVCARCTGVYLGFLVGALPGLAGRALGRPTPAGAGLAVVAWGLIGVLLVQAVGERWGFWSSGNGVRVLLGLLGGAGIGTLLVRLAAHQLPAGTPGVNGEPSRRARAGVWLAVGAGIVGVLGMGVWHGLHGLMVVLTFAGLILVYGLLNVALAGTLMGFLGGRVAGWRWNRLSMAAAVLALYGAEWLLFALLR